MHSQRFMTLEEIDKIHAAVLAESGGFPGYRDKGRVDSAIHRARSGYYRNLFEEAAAMMESVSNNQGFIDGNKRTAFVSTDTFLRWNGFYLETAPQAAYDLMIKATKGKVFKFGLILEWILDIYEVIERRDWVP